MGRTVLLIEPYVTFGVNYETSTLYVDWWGHVTKQNVLDGCALMLEMLEREKCTRVLNNNTFVTGSWKAVTLWAATNGFTDLDSTSCQQFAWVKPPYSDLSSDYLNRLDVQNVEVCIFNSLLSAEKWLASPKVIQQSKVAALDY